MRERLGKVEVTDRTGERVADGVAVQRLQRAVKEFDGWASAEEFGAAAVDYVKDHGLIDHDIDSSRPAGLLESQVPDEEPHRVELVARDDGGLRVRVTERHRAPLDTVAIPVALFRSPGFQRLERIHHRLAELIGPPPFTVRPGKERHTGHVRRPAAGVLSLAKEGIEINRFKGLGEMNPRTALGDDDGPAHRTLQQVTMDDARGRRAVHAADGRPGRAAPRVHRANAREVKTLDV